MEKFDKIFVLVSGGIDSTFLYEIFKKNYNDKVYPVNCYNPFETSETLTKISQDPNYIQIKPKKKYNYGQIIKESFLKIPEAKELKKKKKYHKKIFPCCYYIKHKAFLNKKLFKEPNTVVISGIKRGDGQQRFFWLHSLLKKNTFFHRHKTGQLYCYPFRDYTFKELPNITIKRLKRKYPTLKHSGCSICPILVLFNIESEGERYINSVRFYKNNRKGGGR